jgi:N-glycosylase/DNA lyase
VRCESKAPQPSPSFIFENMTAQEFESVWMPYLGLDVDYAAVRQLLARHGGDAMRRALDFAPGLRVMRQEPWECLVSFILSQNANIPRIRNMVAALCEGWGTRLECGGYTFPTPEALARLQESDLAAVRAGYRAGYIIDAARQVTKGKLRHIFMPDGQKKYAGAFSAAVEYSTHDLRVALQEIRGVGQKVADCVLLYAFARTECSPADVWMKRVMAAHFPNGFPKEIEHIAGLAQQFLFHYIRNYENMR